MEVICMFTRDAANNNTFTNKHANNDKKTDGVVRYCTTWTRNCANYFTNYGADMEIRALIPYRRIVRISTAYLRIAPGKTRSAM